MVNLRFGSNPTTLGYRPPCRSTGGSRRTGVSGVSALYRTGSTWYCSIWDWPVLYLYIFEYYLYLSKAVAIKTQTSLTLYGRNDKGLGRYPYSPVKFPFFPE